MPETTEPSRTRRDALIAAILAAALSLASAAAAAQEAQLHAVGPPDSDGLIPHELTLPVRCDGDDGGAALAAVENETGRVLNDNDGLVVGGGVGWMRVQSFTGGRRVLLAIVPVGADALRLCVVASGFVARD